MAGTSNLSALIAKSPAIRRELGGSTIFDGRMPPQAALDRDAENSITGKFNVKKKNLCCTCNTFKSANGTCFC